MWIFVFIFSSSTYKNWIFSSVCVFLQLIPFIFNMFRLFYIFILFCFCGLEQILLFMWLTFHMIILLSFHMLTVVYAVQCSSASTRRRQVSPVGRLFSPGSGRLGTHFLQLGQLEDTDSKLWTQNLKGEKIHSVDYPTSTCAQHLT